jgi:hypothetical protein
MDVEMRRECDAESEVIGLQDSSGEECEELILPAKVFFAVHRFLRALRGENSFKIKGAYF